MTQENNNYKLMTDSFKRESCSQRLQAATAQAGLTSRLLTSLDSSHLEQCRCWCSGRAISLETAVFRRGMLSICNLNLRMSPQLEEKRTLPTPRPAPAASCHECFTAPSQSKVQAKRKVLEPQPLESSPAKLVLELDTLHLPLLVQRPSPYPAELNASALDPINPKPWIS